jgi:hypothetical protein
VTGPHLGAHLAAAPGEVPVEPDGPTAQRWAREELSDPIYNEQPSLLDRLIDWVLEQLDRLSGAAEGLDVRTAVIVLGSLLLLAAVIALVVTGPVRRARAARTGSAEVFGDDTRSTAELRASADRLAGEGRWSEAVLDRFRAILRSLEDRALLDDRPGRTAHEATDEAAARLPACREELVRAGRLFDDVCYGHQRAAADDDAWLRELDQRLGGTRPVSAGVGRVAGMERPR